MAEREIILAIAEVEKELTCAICYGIYNNPRLLHCGHSFCNECIDNLPVNRERDKYHIICPVCCTRAWLPHQSGAGVSIGAGFPAAFFTSRFKDVYDQMISRRGHAQATCETCLQTSCNITGLCRECHKTLCKQCSDDHEHKDTIIISLDETRTQSPAKQGKKKCSNHEEPLELFCEKCQVLICSTCTLDVHKGHENNLVSDCCIKYRCKLKDRLQGVNDEITAVVDVVTALTDREDAIRMQGEDAKEEMRIKVTEKIELHRSEKQQGQIKDELQIMTKEVDTVIDKKLNLITEEKKRAETHLAELKNCYHIVNESIKAGDQCPDRMVTSAKQKIALMEDVLTQSGNYEINDLLMSSVSGEEQEIKELTEKFTKQIEDRYPQRNGYAKVLDSALVGGHVIAKYTKFFICGPPEAGKTSFLKLLLDEEPPPNKHHSTPAAVVPEVRAVSTSVMECTTTWKKVDRNSLKEIICNAVIVEGKKIQIKDDQTIDEHETSTDKNQEQNLETASSKENTSQLTSGLESSPSPVSNTAEEVLDMLFTLQMPDTFPEVHWIYAVDSGGQAAFLDIAPALLRYHSVNILTHKLSEKLEDKPKFYYSIDGENIGNPMQRPITHLELLETSFRSLASVNPPTLPHIAEFVQFSQDSPYTLVLGTFYDKINDSIESLDEKNEKLHSKLKQYEKVEHVYFTCEEKIIFPLNAIGRGEEEKKMAKKIRKKICQSYIKAKIPIRWFFFQLDLDKHKETSKIICFNDCLVIGKAFKMDYKEVKAALMYFHDLTIYLYFFEVLPNVVFLDPQPLLNKLSELIAISFADAKYIEQLEEKDIFFPPTTRRKLSTEGTFSQNILDQKYFSRGFSEHFSPKDFLKLMEHLLILSHLPDQPEEYFLPCILSTSDQLQRDPTLTENVDPLILRWGEYPLPQGLFPALVIKLLSSEQPKFQLFPQDSEKRYRNAMYLKCSLGGTVLLQDTTSWLEIYYNGQRHNCHQIHQVVKKGIDEVVKKFYCIKRLNEPEHCFHCSLCKTNEHICHIHKDKFGITLTCSKDGRNFPIDKNCQLPWLTSEIEDEVLDQPPPEKVFKKQVPTLARLLSDFGNRLSLANELLSADLITSECYKNATDNAPKSDQEKGQFLLNGLISIIDTQPHLLKKLASVLKSVESFQSVAEKL